VSAPAAIARRRPRRPAQKARRRRRARPAGGRRKFPRSLLGPPGGARQEFEDHQRNHAWAFADRPSAALARWEAERDRREPVALLLLLEVRAGHQRRRPPDGVFAGEL